MNQLKATKSVLVISVDEKKNSNLYTFIDLETNSVLTCLGVKKEIELHKPITANLNIKLTNELIEKKDGSREFINRSSIFIEGFEE